MQRMFWSLLLEMSAILISVCSSLTAWTVEKSLEWSEQVCSIKDHVVTASFELFKGLWLWWTCCICFLCRSTELEPKLLDAYWHRHLLYLLQENRKVCEKWGKGAYSFLLFFSDAWVIFYVNYGMEPVGSLLRSRTVEILDWNSGLIKENTSRCQLCTILLEH